MLGQDITILIHTCGAYSDLWDGQVMLLNENWCNDKIRRILLTDTNPNDKSYENVDIVCAGEGTEITQRIQHVLPLISTEYIFVTLDDYYLIDKVDENRFEDIICAMNQYGIDYTRLFSIPDSNTLFEECKDIYRICFEEKKSSYYVNLYPGIWKKDFMASTVKETMNAWQYEVSLTPHAIKNGAVCVMCKNHEYEILDVVRKGKILHKANKYFKSNPVYTGNRELISYKEEIRLGSIALVQKLLPRKVLQFIKKILIKNGHTFYSELDE